MLLTMINILTFAVLLPLQPSFFFENYEDRYNRVIQYQPEVNIHDQWDALLRKHVDVSGNVDYTGFKEDRSKLADYLSALSKNVPADNAIKSEKLVYYINIYNAATVKLILDHYPINSIKDIKSPWDRKWIKVGNSVLSLGTIEHKILRKLDEPRIHFAINCASYSCPKLINRAFTQDKLETQLENASKDFINDTKRNRIGHERIEISQIFKWYKSDFTVNGSLTDYINRYSDVPVKMGVKVQYIKYDWSLNEAK